MGKPIARTYSKRTTFLPSKILFMSYGVLLPLFPFTFSFHCKVMRCYKIERRNKYVSSLFKPEFKFEYEIAEVIILEKCVGWCFRSFSRKTLRCCSAQSDNENEN